MSRLAVVTRLFSRLIFINFGLRLWGGYLAGEISFTLEGVKFKVNLGVAKLRTCCGGNFHWVLDSFEADWNGKIIILFYFWIIGLFCIFG